MGIASDVTVIGGGLAGICAAIAAARQGAKTVLVNDRPVLGGNASSEIRVWTCGATSLGANRYATETGIIGELCMENLFRNPEGNPVLFDAVLLDFVRREENLSLYQNCCADDVKLENGLLTSVSALQRGTGKRYKFSSPLFIDATGDGVVAHLAGSEEMFGCEARAQFGEDAAGEEESDATLGSTLLFYVKNQGKKVRYVRPDFAYPWKTMQDVMKKTGRQMTTETQGCDLWWIEFGGQLMVEKDDDKIGEELQKIVYGLWDYVKNSGEFDADNLTLEWVGSVPGKRESRRVVGKSILTQNEICAQQPLWDAVCYGGWFIDQHPPGGFFDARPACEQIKIGIYDIPLSCLCCKSPENLLLAGRDASMSHVAFASARVMKTCALMGQAVGTAAALSKEMGKLPCAFEKDEIKTLQQRLLKEDSWLPGRENEDECDLARRATVTAAEGAPFEEGNISAYQPLTQNLYLMFPPMAEQQELLLPLKGTTVSGEIFSSDKKQNQNLHQTLGTFCRPITEEWTAISLPVSGEGSLIVRLNQDESCLIGVSEHVFPGALGAWGSYDSLQMEKPCFRFSKSLALFGAENLTDGHSRPFGAMHLWAAELMKRPQVELSFQAEISTTQLRFYFDNELSRDYLSLKPDYQGNGWDRMPEGLVRGCTIRAYRADGTLVKEQRLQENHHRCALVPFVAEGISKIVVDEFETWGSPLAQVYQIRVY